LEPAELEVNKIKVKCAFVAKYLTTTYVVSAGNSISSSINSYLCDDLSKLIFTGALALVGRVT
jgi:hypothetical protein